MHVKFRFALILLLINSSFGFAGIPAGDTTIKVSAPQSRIVYQRSINNTAWVPIRGEGFKPSTRIEGKMTPREKGQGVATGWVTIATTDIKGRLNGTIKVKGGWYDLHLRIDSGKKTQDVYTIERIGIGEVFIVVGHSVAQGGTINGEGANDDRVSTVLLDEKIKQFDSLYLTTGNPDFLPDPVFVHASSGVAPAPFGHGSYIWSKFAEKIVQKENVPVLIYNAAFGGTSLEHWAKSSQGILFEHSFVRSKIRMPYINLLNTFKKYIPLTGLRALLADQGQNDLREKDSQKIFDNYLTFIEQARKDLGYSKLALVVNQQMPADAPAVLIAQKRMIQQPYSFPGPDYNKDLSAEDKYDGIHLSASGVVKASDLWADALTPYFFKHAVPYIPLQK